MKNFVCIALLALLCGQASMSCSGPGSIKQIEEMSDLEYSKWSLYIQLGVKIGANRLVQEGVVTTSQLNVAAGVIEGIGGEPIAGGVKSLILPALQKAGFQNDEVEFILLVAEQELLARGALEWINPQTNVLELSPRTLEILKIVANSLRTAGVVTSAEANQASQMKADFCRQAAK